MFYLFYLQHPAVAKCKVAGDNLEMTLLIKHAGATLVFIFLTVSLSWGGALDGKGIFCVGLNAHSNNYSHHYAWKFVNKSVEFYGFKADSDKIVFTKAPFKFSNYFLSPSKVSWYSKELKEPRELNRKTLELSYKNKIVANCRVLSSNAEFVKEAADLTELFQKRYDENSKGNKI